MPRKASVQPLRISAEGARFAHFSASFIRQSKGRWAREPLLMEPWQLALVSEMLRNRRTSWRVVNALDPWREIEEWVNEPDFANYRGRRQYREAYIQMAKKQGKSTMSSSLGLYFLLADGEEGAEVYSVAGSTDQAKIVFQQAREMAEASPRIMHHVRVYKDAIWVPATNSIYRVLGGDADYDEGYNPHAVIMDELHVHKDRKLYDAMTSHIHTGARLDPIVVIITNAGTDVESICYEVYEHAKAVINKVPEARKDLFAYVPELDEEDRQNPAKWKKVNPSSWTQVDDLLEARKKFPRFVFERRHLNVWTEAEDLWLEYQMWKDCETTELSEMIQPNDPIYVGVDLGLKYDTAAVVWSRVTEDNLIPVKSQVWGLVPDPSKSKRPPCHTEIFDERLPLRLVLEYVLELARTYQVMEVAYDPYRFEFIAQELDMMGFVVVEWPQTDQRMIPATETVWNAVVRDSRLRHDGDPVLRQHVMAAVAEETGRGYRLSKRKATRPNDACIAMLMSVARAEANAQDGVPSFEVLV